MADDEPWLVDLLKDKAAELVPKAYGFIDPKSLASPTAEEIEAVLEGNRAIVAKHRNNKFWYKASESV